MRKMSILAAGLALGLLAAGGAQAACLKKGAIATAESEKSAKWYALETMVQSVGWDKWPSFLADGSVPGYRIASQSYRCSKDAGGVTCRGQAVFCPTGG